MWLYILVNHRDNFPFLFFFFFLFYIHFAAFLGYFHHFQINLILESGLKYNSNEIAMLSVWL
jgi:hypothetical protein